MDYLDKKGEGNRGEILGGWDGVIAAIYHPKENASENRYVIYDIRTEEIMDERGAGDVPLCIKGLFLY